MLVCAHLWIFASASCAMNIIVCRGLLSLCPAGWQLSVSSSTMPPSAWGWCSARSWTRRAAGSLLSVPSSVLQQQTTVSLSCVLYHHHCLWLVCLQADASAAGGNEAACGFHLQQDGRRPCAQAAAGDAGLLGAGDRSEGYTLVWSCKRIISQCACATGQMLSKFPQVADHHWDQGHALTLDSCCSCYRLGITLCL